MRARAKLHLTKNIVGKNPNREPEDRSVPLKPPYHLRTGTPCQTKSLKFILLPEKEQSKKVQQCNLADQAKRKELIIIVKFSKKMLHQLSIHYFYTLARETNL